MISNLEISIKLRCYLIFPSNLLQLFQIWSQNCFLFRRTLQQTNPKKKNFSNIQLFKFRRLNGKKLYFHNSTLFSNYQSLVWFERKKNWRLITLVSIKSRFDFFRSLFFGRETKFQNQINGRWKTNTTNDFIWSVVRKKASWHTDKPKDKMHFSNGRCLSACAWHCAPTVLVLHCSRILAPALPS